MDNIDPELWILVHGGDCEAIANDESTPGFVLEWLATDNPIDILLQVATNPSAPPATLEKLAETEDEYRDVRCRVADNPNTPTSTLQKLAGDKGWWVARMVAFQPNTPISTLQKLAGHEHGEVRKAAEAALRERQDA